MAGILNKTARQYNLKCIGKKGERITARVIPGFNIVEDNIWNILKDDSYVKGLCKQNHLDFGDNVEELFSDEENPHTSATKKVVIPGTEKDEDVVDIETVKEVYKAYETEFGKEEAKEVLVPYDIKTTRSLSKLSDEQLQELYEALAL